MAFLGNIPGITTRCVAVALAAIALCGPASPTAVSASPPPFRGSIHEIGPKLRAYMTGKSWRAGCPVGFRELRLLRVRHHAFDGGPRMGNLIVHRRAAAPVLRVMRRLYAAGFPIRRMRLVDDYGANDFRSIEADNTSAFNCRFVAGTRRWSQHAYGVAIDVNPIENPYVDANGTVEHAASRSYVDRRRRRAGMAYEGGALVEAFDAIGWGWGGRWRGARDYQHFSTTGR